MPKIIAQSFFDDTATKATHLTKIKQNKLTFNVKGLTMFEFNPDEDKLTLVESIC